MRAPLATGRQAAQDRPAHEHALCSQRKGLDYVCSAARLCENGLMT